MGALREIIYGFCTVKGTKLFRNQETSFYENKKVPSTKTRNFLLQKNKKLPSTENKKFLLLVRSAFMSIFERKYDQDCLTVVGAERANLGLLEAAFS